jgi:hypothetical protein
MIFDGDEDNHNGLNSTKPAYEVFGNTAFFSRKTLKDVQSNLSHARGDDSR